MTKEKPPIEFRDLDDFKAFIQWDRKGEETSAAIRIGQELETRVSHPGAKIELAQLIEIAVQFKEAVDNAKRDGFDRIVSDYTVRIKVLSEIGDRLPRYRAAQSKKSERRASF
ncbi:MAG: hypothetical protein AAGB32_05195 [Pseudomonadota bacterium]